MVIDQLIERIKEKKNPCIVGIDPEWNKLPVCYRTKYSTETEAIYHWAVDVIDAVADVVPAIKPQMAFFEVFGSEGIRVHEKIIRYARCQRKLMIIDDSKRNDIGNTARAYAYAHLAKQGPINADFLTVSPFLGTDSIQPFIDVARRDGKGIFVLVKTSNPSSGEISEATNAQGEKISNWLAHYLDLVGKECMGDSGYSSIGAVVGATFPEEAGRLRSVMKQQFFLVPGFGAQGGGVKDIIPCFCEDGLGAVVSSSRGVLYKHLEMEEYDHSKAMYMEIVHEQARAMQKAVYQELRANFCKMVY